MSSPVSPLQGYFCLRLYPTATGFGPPKTLVVFDLFGSFPGEDPGAFLVSGRVWHPSLKTGSYVSFIKTTKSDGVSTGTGYRRYPRKTSETQVNRCLPTVFSPRLRCRLSSPLCHKTYYKKCWHLNLYDTLFYPSYPFLSEKLFTTTLLT